MTRTARMLSALLLGKNAATGAAAGVYAQVVPPASSSRCVRPCVAPRPRRLHRMLGSQPPNRCESLKAQT